jgi:hypothetical protein
MMKFGGCPASFENAKELFIPAKQNKKSPV